MRFLIVTVTAVALAACAGDSPPESTKCSGAVYEPCSQEHECDSEICQNFLAEGFQVCSQACDAATPCPGDGTCENAVCKPAAPDDCTLF